MSFKDIIVFTLRMYGVWLVINTLVGVSTTSALLFELTQYGNQLHQVLASIIFPLVIGFLLALMPYKVSNFLIRDNLNCQLSCSEFSALGRLAVGLLGIYIVVTGLQALVYDIMLFNSLSSEYKVFDDYPDKRIAAFSNSAARIFLGGLLVIGHHRIGLWLTAMRKI